MPGLQLYVVQIELKTAVPAQDLKRLKDARAAAALASETLKAHGRTHCTVVDIVHLPSDDYILENHKRKRRLQALTLGEVQEAVSRPDRIASDS